MTKSVLNAIICNILICIKNFLPHNSDYVTSVYCIIPIMFFLFCQHRKSCIFSICLRWTSPVSYDVCQGVLWDFFKKIFNIAVNRAFEAVLYAPFRFPLYKGGWFQQMSDRVYRQVLLYLSARNRMSEQTSVWNCEGIPYLLIHRHFRINSSAFSILHSGRAVFRFLKQTPSHFLYCVI